MLRPTSRAPGTTRAGADVQPAEGLKDHRLAAALLLAAATALAGFGALPYFGGSSTNPASASGSVQIVGSESMRPSVSTCAEDFMTRNPEADVMVKGGGSGDGVAALLHGITDIAMASRELTQREREYARAKAIELTVYPLALDGVSIVVNRMNPVDDMSLKQLRDVFTGRLRNWGDLGAGMGEILPFARAAGSGTAFLFGERVLGEASYGTGVQRLVTNEAIVAEVASRPEGIGYTDLGALRRGGDRVKPVAVQADEQSSPVIASPESVSSGHYPLSRRLTLITAGSSSDTAKAFIDFCLSAAGQILFQRAGFIAAKPTLQEGRG
jgi:phosphate transport system substrate-binding protein